jgi:hypothetical protein
MLFHRPRKWAPSALARQRRSDLLRAGEMRPRSGEHRL